MPALEADKIYAYDQDPHMSREYVRGSEAHYRDDWMAGASYAIEDVVSHDGAWYFCLRGNTGMVPMGQIDEFWSPLVEIGPDESLGDLDDIITDILERIKDLEEAIDAIRDQIQGILDQIQGILDQIAGILDQIQAIRDLIEAIIDYLRDLRERVDNAQAGVDVLAAKGRSVVVVLCERQTPETGPDVVEAFVPHEWDGEEVASWLVTRASVRVAMSGGAPSVQFEKSTGVGIFIPTPITTVTLGNDAYEAAVSGVSGTVTSGDKLRMNVLEVGTAENWYVSVQLYHPFVVPTYSGTFAGTLPS